MPSPLIPARPRRRVSACEEQHILPLPSGRQLAYAVNGPSTSRTVVLFFSGLMSVGLAPHVPAPCRSLLRARWIAPTPAGMGRSSTRPASLPYHVTLARDATALLHHLYPSDDYDALYVAGGSYGTVMAQMLYGAPRTLFPAGDKMVGCLLLAGFSPFKHDLDHARALSWSTWLSVGPPSQLPFQPLQRAFRAAISPKVRTVEGAAAFLRATVLAGPAEREMLAAHVARLGETEEGFVERLARAAVASCENWDGFMEVAEVLREDWGFAPGELEGAAPLLVVASEGDKIGSANSAWLAANYKNATARTIPGGHISSMFYMDEIWEEMISLASKCTAVAEEE
ncbi:hypothetical protein ISF_07866 [Cordyceps fumosorosea ARSEF 2679]|uniref:AB hydrolase-1 domain-containing protein n=1 Tax=Cordyceps fumosorosea (strain ARSEF 2679) TaxID=1081104 RepID=A0A167NNN3_CORFA|nr:hypothetical protein ISF_07866 [Cordyceps fumosorosea ARSEF 2679]OAA55761.1 hypothetical protein ISF_07866 [Cordyceps fumosorosea ARSEF 2679]